MRRRWLAVFLLLMLGVAAGAAVRGKTALYVGGTLPLPENTKGYLDFSNATTLDFVSSANASMGRRVQIPYRAITSIEYGEKVGRRLGVALAVNPLFLFSHKRRHYVTLTFADEHGATQGAVIEVGKREIHGLLDQLADRCAVRVEFQSKEAKRYAEKK